MATLNSHTQHVSTFAFHRHVHTPGMYIPPSRLCGRLSVLLADMAHDSYNKFSLEQHPTITDVFISSESHHEPPSFDNPPPWEPHFEDLSSQSSPSSLSRRPLDPPPPCFSVPSPLRIRSYNFPPFRIPAVSDKLADGFRILYPHNILERHGITRSDWVRFLEDLGVAARLSCDGLSAVGMRVPIAPLIPHRVFPSRVLGGVYDRHFARCPIEEVRALIQIWNQCAFERRKIRVLLQAQPIEMSGKLSFVLIVESL